MRDSSKALQQTKSLPSCSQAAALSPTVFEIGHRITALRRLRLEGV